jgi:hypothetical protein
LNHLAGTWNSDDLKEFESVTAAFEKVILGVAPLALVLGAQAARRMRLMWT